jgi:hypothetical protein
MSWPEDDNGNGNGNGIDQRSPGNSLRHFVKRVTRRFTHNLPSTPTSSTSTDTKNHNSHLTSKSKRKPFFPRPFSSSRPLQPHQNPHQDPHPHQNNLHIHNHPLSPNPRPSLSFLRRSSSTPLLHTAPPNPNLFELTPYPGLPEELVSAILIEAAHDLCSARRLVLVSRHVKGQVQKVLYANVHLGDMTAIRLFARTVWEASRLPELRLAPTAPRGPEPSRERVLDDLREEEEGTTTVVASPSSVPLVEMPSAIRIRPLRLIRRWSQPPPSSPSSSSSLPVPPSPALSFPPPPSTTATPIGSGSTLTRAFFATTVRALTLVVQEDHFRILFPDVLDCARLILCACDAVRELEISGDLIRRTDPASIVAPVPTLTPVPASPSPAMDGTGMGTGMGTGAGIGPPVLPPIPMVLNDDALLPSISTANPPASPPQPTATLASAPLMLATPTAATQMLHTDLYVARMRPTHLNLLAPHNNVNFHLPMLQHVTHLRYAICPPRILGWRSNNDGLINPGAGAVGAGVGAGIHAVGGPALAQVNVAGSASTSNNNTQSAVAAGAGAGGTGATGRGRLLRRLTHVAFDYQIGRESGHGGMGIGVWGAGNFVGIVREALAAGGSPSPPAPLDGGGPLAPHAEDGEGEGNTQGLGQGPGPGPGPGVGVAQGEGANGGSSADAGAGGEGTLDADADVPDYLDELGEGPPLERVVVKIILRPRAEVLSKFNAIWPRLDALRKSDARLVYFGAKWRDNEMFGENLWERVRAVEERRDRDRERVRGRGGGARQRSNSAASSATAGGGRRRRASSVSIGWFQDG